MKHRTVYTFIKARFLLAVLLAGGMLRVGMLIANLDTNATLFHNNLKLIDQKINSPDAPFSHPFGAEISNVAYALVCKKAGFSNPFGGHTGPTAWVAPGMVSIYAISFYVFGGFTFFSIMFCFLLSLVLSLAMIVLVYRLCLELFNNTIIASTAAVFFAFDPQDVFIFKRINQQDFNFLVFLFLLVFYLFIRCVKSKSFKDTLYAAFAAGVAMLFNPVIIAPVILVLVVIFKRITISQGAIFLIIIFLITAPYILYQRQNLKAWMFIKSNGLYEIYQGNAPDSSGALTIELFEKYHPIFNQKEYQQYKTMGERDYVAAKFIQFKHTFDPGSFVRLIFKKFIYFFFVFPPIKVRELGTPAYFYFAYSLRGLSLLVYFFMKAKRITEYDALLYLYVMGYALPYCCAGIMYRYSFPIVPLSTVLAAYSLCAIWHWIKTGTALYKQI